MELGEPVAIGVISEEDWKCPFEHKKPGKVDNDLKNDSGKLGDRVEKGWSTQLWVEEGAEFKPKTNQTLAPPCPKGGDCPDGSVSFGGQSYPYLVSAHHLIPGNEALAKSGIKKFIEKGEKISGDIGYDVNGAENGLWLPTHSALSTEMKEGRALPEMAAPMKYSRLTSVVAQNEEENADVGTFQQRYAYQVMLKTGRQFHDRHLDYSNEVKDQLDKIAVKLLNVSGYHCDKCKEAKSADGKLPPPHTLVHRLNALSRRMAGFLWGKPLRWQAPLFTSRFAESLAIDYRIWEARGLN